MKDENKAGAKIQGMDPRGDVFNGLASILYAAESPISGSYIDSSRIATAVADMAAGGLRGKRVLDVGCGFGTTTMALARHAPKEIVAVDTSAAHLELLEAVLKTNRDIGEYVNSKNGAREVLGEFREKTVAHFCDMRAEFKDGVFMRNGGRLTTLNLSALDLTKENVGKVDVIVGNNFLHWPVNQRRAIYAKEGLSETEAYEKAVDDSFSSLARILSSGGVVVLLQPKDFVRLDDDLKLDADLEAATMASHPVFIKMHTMINEVLSSKYGIHGRKVPTTAGLFHMSRMKELFGRNGLELVHTVFAEAVCPCDPVDAFFVRLPMLLGTIPLSFDDKMALGRYVREELNKVLTPSERKTPVRAQYFVFVLRT